MAKRINLGSQSVAQGSFQAAPVAGNPTRPANPPGITGTLPMPQNQVLKGFKPTGSEKVVLEKLGWKPGDPIPTDLSDTLAEVLGREMLDAMASATTNLAPPVAPDTPPLAQPKEIPLDALPPEKRAEILAAFRTAKALADADNQQQAQLSQMNPSIAEAIKTATATAPSVGVVDDRRKEAYYGTNTPKPTAQHDPFGATHTRTNCQQCGHDLSIEVEMPSKEDIFVFTQLAISGKPFSKEYYYYDDQLVIRFRGLTVKEGDLITRQCELEKAEGELKTPADVYEQSLRYAMALQTTYVKTPETVFNLPNNLRSWEEKIHSAGVTPEGKATILPIIKESFFEDVVQTETLGRIVSLALSDFNRLCRHMEVNYKNRNFMKGITASR